MNTKKIVLTFAFLLTLLYQMAAPSAVYAAGIVGTGTPESCTEASLDTALTAGGAVSFDCGGPATILLTSPKVITSNTQIDGAGLITLSGGNTVRLFTVNSPSTLNLSNLIISNGFVTDQNGGAVLVNNGTTVNISNTTFSSNQSMNGYGGAIYVGGGTLNVTNSTFTNNNANVEIFGEFSLGGGAIANNDGTVTISGSTFNGNSVTSHTADGGAIYNGDFDAGFVGHVGFPDANPDVLTVTNSTFYNNHVQYAGGEGDSAGAIRSTSVLTLVHNTFSNNDSGDFVEDGDESGAVTISHGTATLRNNIFANSTSFDCAIRSTVTSLISTGNLIEKNFGAPFGCGTPAQTADPLLGPLQNNGGPTQTMALLSGSPAINAAVDANCSPTDQRGVSRPQGSHCDIGAYEVSATDVQVTIGSSVMGPYPVPANPSLIKNYAGIVDGPVKVKSTNGENVFASQRVIYGNSFNELMGYPANKFSTEYWFPWYDQVNMRTWILVGNPSTTQTAYVDIYIAGVKKNDTPYVIAPGGNVTPQFPGMVDGPVRVVSVTGTGTPSPINIFTSERSLYGTSFNEVMGYPIEQFASEYWFPWYDQVNMRTWILVGNPSTTQTAYVDIYIAGTRRADTNGEVKTYSILPGGNITPQFPGMVDGPVRVVSVSGDGTPSPINIFTSERSLYGTSFNEVMGYPTEQFTTEYYYPWYDNQGMRTWVLVGNPSTTQTAYVDIYIGGVKVNDTVGGVPYSITPNGNIIPTFNKNTGPVHVVSVTGTGTLSPINIFTSERALYGPSFNEMMGYPGDQLTSEYWFTWYDNVNMQSKIYIGKP